MSPDVETMLQEKDEKLQQSPEWLNEEFLKNTLYGEEGDASIKVTIKDSRSAIASGENYLGVVYRLTLKIQQNNEVSEKSIIVKTIPQGGTGLTFFEELGVFERELTFYGETIPKLHKLIKERSLNYENICFTPKFYQSCRKDALFLEDLSPLGYKMANRMAQLDFDHCRVALLTLAKFHASSLVLYEEEPSIVEQWSDPFYSEEKRYLTEPLMMNVTNSLSGVVSKWSGYERFANKIRSFKIFDLTAAAIIPKPGDFCVLNHGDFWTNNIMFKYSPESGKVEDAKLIDFQLIKFSTPASDISMFFYSSLQEEVWHQRDSLIKYYYDALITSMKSFGLDTSVYSLETLNKEITDKLAYAFTISVGLLAANFATSDEIPDFDDLMLDRSGNQVNAITKTHSNPFYEKRMKTFLTHFEKSGLFE